MCPSRIRTFIGIWTSRSDFVVRIVVWVLGKFDSDDERGHDLFPPRLVGLVFELYLEMRDHVHKSRGLGSSKLERAVIVQILPVFETCLALVEEPFAGIGVFENPEPNVWIWESWRKARF